MNSLQKIVFDDQVKIQKVNYNAFYGCANLHTLPTMPFATFVGERALYRCGKITSFDFSSVQTIGINAFELSGLENVVLGKNLTSVGIDAFKGCSKLQKFTVDAQNSIFFNDSVGALYEKQNGTNTLVVFPTGSTVTNFTVKEGVTQITAYAFNEITNLKYVHLKDVVTVKTNSFYKCQQLTNITIGRGTTGLEKDCFLECNAIASFAVENGNTLFKVIDGILFTKIVGNEALIRYPPAKPIAADYTIPSGVKVIYEHAFLKKNEIVNLTISGDVYSIHSNAFDKCTGLKKVIITAPVKSIGSKIFNEARSIETVVIGDAVKMIGKYMFAYNSKLTSLSLGKGILSIESNGFLGCGFSEIIIPDATKYIMPSAFGGCEKLKSVKIGKNLIEIGKEAFKNCVALEHLNLTDATSLERIDENAFASCTMLNEVNFPSSMYIIGTDSFSRDASLKRVTFSGLEQPSYCSSSTFDYTNIAIVEVRQNYVQKEFCGKEIRKTLPEPPSPSIESSSSDSSYSILFENETI